MIAMNRFKSTTEYRLYLADVECWGEIAADRMWEEEFAEEARIAAKMSLEDKIRKDNLTRVQEGRVDSMRRFHELTKTEQDNLTVQEARLILNLIVLGDKDDKEAFQEYLVKAVQAYRQASDTKMKDALKKCIVGAIKDECKYRLANRSYPSRELIYLKQSSLFEGETKPLEPNCRYPKCSMRGKAACDTCTDNPKNFKHVVITDHNHHCSRCGSDVVGGQETWEYHRDVVCPELPANRIKTATIMGKVSSVLAEEAKA